MTKEEWVKIGCILKASYTSSTFIPDKESNIVWYEMLKDLPTEEVKRAVIDYVATEHFQPTIADIRLRVGKMRVGATDWGTSWGKVVNLIGKYGRYNFKGACNELTPIEIKTIEKLGWTNLCNSDTISVERANYRTLYEEMVGEEIKKQSTPLMLEDKQCMKNLQSSSSHMQN